MAMSGGDPQPPRTSYRQLIALPIWGLYEGERVVASIRAHNAEQAKGLFKRAGLKGERVKRITPEAT